MHFLTLKTTVVLVTLITTVIFGIQLYALNQIYQQENAEFNLYVKKGVHSLFEHKLLSGKDSGLNQKLIQPNEDSYLVTYDMVTNHDSVKNWIANEFRSLDFNCRFDISFYGKSSLQYGSSPFYQEGNHLILNFPGKDIFLLKRISPWIISGFFILLCQAILVILLYHFYRHRAWIGIKNDFVNNLVHEFSTPISVMKIVGEVLGSEGIERNPHRIKKYAGIIKEQTSHLDLKVTRIMELALSEKQHSILEKEFVNVNELVQQAVNLVHPLIEERKASVEFIKSDLPIEMLADSTYLTQAIVNLLDNSLKYANQPHIKLETAVAEKNCIISVRDNGIGMEKKYFKHIFRKFYRIPTGNVHNVKGFGIGLNFVKNVIDAHDGRIEVSSIPGIGTAFSIQLPLT